MGLYWFGVYGHSAPEGVSFMAPRAPGRPKAAHPRDVRVTVRLTEEEVDQLQRYVGRTTRGTLADTIRSCTFRYLDT